MSVEYTTTAVVVYNFEVEDAHTYYVGSNALLVHNKCGGKRFTPDQEALIDIAKEIIRRKKPITKSDEDILWKWVEEVGFDKYTNSFHSATYDSYQSGAVLHMKINSDHINIIAK